MFPEILPATTFKKNYNFVWMVMPDLSNYKDAAKSFRLISEGLDLVASVYVSQLAEKVTPPDDEIEYDKVVMGNLEYPVPKKVKMNEIVVTYLDDSINTVYNYHKAWQNMIRNEGMSLSPIPQFCMNALHITTETALTAAEYASVFNKVTETMSPLTSALGIDKATSTLLQAGKPTSIIKYPRVFPVKIQRDESNKGGEEVSRVTVTYARVPVLHRTRKPLMKFEGDKNLSSAVMS